MPEFLKILNHSKRFRKNPKHLKSSAAVSTILGLFEHSKRSKKTQHSKKKQSIQKVQKIQKTPTQQIPENSKNKQNRHKKKKWNGLECFGILFNDGLQPNNPPMSIPLYARPYPERRKQL